jgi:hypothetical protein
LALNTSTETTSETPETVLSRQKLVLYVSTGNYFDLLDSPAATSDTWEGTASSNNYLQYSEYSTVDKTWYYILRSTSTPQEDQPNSLMGTYKVYVRTNRYITF